VGVSPVALGVAAAAYAVRMFALTGFYHRYFAHRTFQASRPVQFVFACSARPACSAVRCGGRRTTATTIATPTPGSIRTRRACTDSCGAIWAGF
jgi:Delta-9 acyl-phospholipid desaturase (EC 1.14.19.-)